MDRRIISYFATEWANVTPFQLTPSLVSNLMTKWKNVLSPTTAYHYAYALKRFLTYVDDQHSTKLRFMVPRLHLPQPRKVTCSDEQFAAMLRHAQPWFAFFLKLCRVLGLRHSEAANLTPQDYNEDTGCISFERKKAGASDLPVPPDIALTIRYAKSVNPHAPICVTLGAHLHHANPKLQRHTIHREFGRVRKLAGADPRLIIHDLRRTAATRVYDETRDLRLAQQLLGHRHLGSTLHYLSPNNRSELEQAIRDAAPKQIDQLPLATEVKQ